LAIAVDNLASAGDMTREYDLRQKAIAQALLDEEVRA
jgi:hypothetical protein